MTALDTKTGMPHYQAQRIDAIPNVFGSPVGAAGRVYIPGREGATVVLRHGPKLEILGVNELNDPRRVTGMSTAKAPQCPRTWAAQALALPNRR